MRFKAPSLTVNEGLGSLLHGIVSFSRRFQTDAFEIALFYFVKESLANGTLCFVSQRLLANKVDVCHVNNSCV